MRAKKRDANQSEIKNVLEAIGFVVYNTASYGDGFPDLLCVGDSGKVYLVEIKQPEGGHMTVSEVRFIMRLVNPAYRIFTDPDQAAALLKE